MTSMPLVDVFGKYEVKEFLKPGREAGDGFAGRDDAGPFNKARSVRAPRAERKAAVTISGVSLFRHMTCFLACRPMPRIRLM